MDDRMLERIAREAGAPGLVDLLSERLAPTDLGSLLLAVARRRAAASEPSDVLRRYQEDRLAQPADVDPAALDELEQRALSFLPEGFERIDLSPVCPLGTSSVLGGISQDWVVATMRSSEVVSDPTNVLALECALRRRSDRRRPVRLAAAHRSLRAQPVERPFTAHFRLFALCSADRSGAVDAMRAEHESFYERFLASLELGPVEIDRSPRKRSYYAGAAFALSIGGTEVVEGGLVDWTQRLLGDRKERLLISGVGTEFLARIASSTRG